MRVAKNVALEHRQMLANLRHGMETTAGVVEIDLSFGVEAAEIESAALVERTRVGVLGMGCDETFESGHLVISLAGD
jgi:hypothetical protein